MNTINKLPNYTEEQVKQMNTEYLAESTRETVDNLSILFNKRPRSIIAKLSHMGIYKAPTRTTKSGTPIIKKVTLVQEISDYLDGVEITSLVKANKQDLERLVLALYEQVI